jgi:hypothetical protein
VQIIKSNKGSHYENVKDYQKSVNNTGQKRVLFEMGEAAI